MRILMLVVIALCACERTQNNPTHLPTQAETQTLNEEEECKQVCPNTPVPCTENEWEYCEQNNR